MSYRVSIVLTMLVCIILGYWSFLDGKMWMAGLSGLGFLCTLVSWLTASPEKRAYTKTEDPFEQSGFAVREQVAGDEEVLRALQAGSKIAAIKIYRENHGCGLKEAKEAVEAMERAPRPFN